MARQLVEAFCTERLPCWFDEQQLDIGAELRASLRTAISQSDIYLYLNSNAANESKWVQDELKFAIGLEYEEKLCIVPVQLADNNGFLPSLLSGRKYTTLNVKHGGASSLAHKLTKIDGHSHIPDNCRLSTTVRLEEHRLVHTLAQTRELLDDHDINVRVLLLDAHYEAIDNLYWNVAEIQLPPANCTIRELKDITEIITDIQHQSREIIKEIRMVCHRFFTTSGGVDNQQYYDAGHERIIRVLLHRLQWNSTYLRYIRDRIEVRNSFVNMRHLPIPFDGYSCDFVSGEQMLGSINVPKHGHPFSEDIKDLIPWGLTSPFTDLLKDEVGVAVGEILALRFMAKSIQTTKLPCPESLKYGLS